MQKNRASSQKSARLLVVLSALLFLASPVKAAQLQFIDVHSCKAGLAPENRSEAIVRWFKETFPVLVDYYNSPTGGRGDNYNIETHTTRVLDLLEEQLPVWQRKKLIHWPAHLRMHELLRAMTALHDIGVKDALDNGGKHLQHKYTIPMLVEYLTKIGFNEAEIKLARSLVGHDAVGQWVTGRISAGQAKELFQQLARDNGMDYQDFLSLQCFFYTIDAASYPMIMDVFKVFRRDEDSRLVLRDRSFGDIGWLEMPTKSNEKAEQKARRQLIETYAQWNQKAPRQPGVNLVSTAMAAAILREPLAARLLGQPLTDSEIDWIGEELNRTHTAFQIPALYSRSGIVPPGIRRVIGPQDLQSGFRDFCNQTTVILVSRLALLNEDSADNRWLDLWNGALFLETEMRNAQAALNSYFADSGHQEEKQLLKRIGVTMQTVLDSPQLRSAARDNREQYRGGGGGSGRDDSRASAQSNVQLPQIFVELFVQQIHADFQDLPQARRERLSQPS